eukprot:gene3532-3801_t
MQHSAARGMHSGFPAADQPAPAAVPEGLAAAVEGPALLYVDGLKSGQYRPDALQQVTVAKLQVLFDDLRAAYPPPQKPSGLTLVDTVGMAESKQSW